MAWVLTIHKLYHRNVIVKCKPTHVWKQRLNAFMTSYIPMHFEVVISTQLYSIWPCNFLIPLSKF